MKKYHIADVLTLSRFFLAGVLIFFTYVGVSSGWVLLVFLLGLLTDALDGPIARTWHYPNDGKRRWWRENKRYEAHDKIADIILLISILCYVVFGLQWEIVKWISLGFGLFAIVVEIWFRLRLRNHSIKDKWIVRIVLGRRHLYATGLYILCMALLWWPTTTLFGLREVAYFCFLAAKFVLTIISVILAVFLIKEKWDRWTQVVTPLNAKTKFGLQTRKKPPKDVPRYRLDEYPHNKCEK